MDVMGACCDVENSCIMGYEKPNDCSWVWNKILKTRSVAQPLIKTMIGDGKTTSFWYDNCHPLGHYT